MLYKKTNVDENLLCKKCKRRYEVPILLPCGDTLCDNCIQQLTYTQTLVSGEKSYWEIECISCNNRHEVPENGFPTNKAINELLKLEPSFEIYDVLCDELKKILNESKSNVTQLNVDLAESENKIHEHSNIIKSNIATRVNGLIENVNETKSSMLNNVNLFEEESLKRLDDYFENFERDVSTKIAECRNLLNNLDINETQQIKSSTNQILDLIQRTNQVSNELTKLYERGLDVKFTKSELSLDEAFVGEIKYDPPVKDEKLSDASLFNMPNKEKKDGVSCSVNDDGLQCKTQ